MHGSVEHEEVYKIAEIGLQGVVRRQQTAAASRSKAGGGCDLIMLEKLVTATARTDAHGVSLMHHQPQSASYLNISATKAVTCNIYSLVESDWVMIRNGHVGPLFHPS